jgi:hypothetical protein
MYNIKFVHNYSVHSSNMVSENKCNALNVIVSADLCMLAPGSYCKRYEMTITKRQNSLNRQ